MNNKIITELANNIKTIRKEKNIKQTKLAEAAGLTQGRIANYEANKIDISNMTLDVALRIAQALDSTIEEVFTKTTRIVESDYKYGIFEASCELRNFESAWDFMENDTEIGAPLEIFRTKQGAMVALENYRSEVTKYRSNGGYYFYFGKVYFVSDLIIYDEDSEDDTDKSIYTHGDGIDITPIKIESED